MEEFLRKEVITHAEQESERFNQISCDGLGARFSALKGID
jgi:hypothetical protein